jgi:hypothetical protein
MHTAQVTPSCEHIIHSPKISTSAILPWNTGQDPCKHKHGEYWACCHFLAHFLPKVPNAVAIALRMLRSEKKSLYGGMAWHHGVWHGVVSSWHGVWVCGCVGVKCEYELEK